jgi:hypothetical protein
MAKEQVPNRIPSKKVTRGTPVILDKNSKDLLWLRANEVIIKDSTGYSYSKYIGGPSASLSGEGVAPIGGTGDGFALPAVDTVDMTDIESITFEEYVDPASLITKYNAIIKIRNGSTSASSVVGVDARVYDSASSSYVAPVKTTTSTTTNNSPAFTTPTPSVPSVIFDRTGSSIAWGWNDSTGLGSFSSVVYQWTVTTLQNGGTTIASGTKTYPSTSSYNIGDSGKTRKYRVSSSQGDLPPSSSARWLKVRTVVTGTNNKKYYSSYSTPI